MVDFFLKRPILASVSSLLILLVGLVALPSLPIAQYPKIAPPTVTVTAQYIGADASTVETAVTTPLERAISAVPGLRYQSSQSGSDGSATITCVFALDRSLDQATNDVQNAVNLASGQLPNEVKQIGVTVTQNSSSAVIVMAVTSSDPRWDRIAMTTFLENNAQTDLQHIPGVGTVTVFGERKHAMRVWLDPTKLARNGVTTVEVLAALQKQNVPIAAGAIGASPTNGKQPYEYAVRAVGRLHDAVEFGRIILRKLPDGGYVRLRDVARVVLGSETYADALYLNGKPTVGIGIQQLQSGNALEISRSARGVFDRLQPSFPPGMEYHVAFDRSDFLRASMRDLVVTLIAAIVLVVLVIFVFLQDWRSTLIPAITIPISLIGTFALMRVLGFSVNTLTLFGLTLATGLVVDDAIVVVENVARLIRERHLAPLQAVRQAMREVTGALIASSICLLAVFIPVAFFPGTTGLLYKQFALTVACSIGISLFNALTLAPVLSALLFRDLPRKPRFFGPFNAAFEGSRRAYDTTLRALLRTRRIVAVLFVGTLALTAWLLMKTPTAFIPEEDQGFVIAFLQGPSYFSLDQTLRVAREAEAIFREQPEVVSIFDDVGYSGSGNASNAATMFVQLRPWSERTGPDQTAKAVLARVNAKLSTLSYVDAIAINPSSVPGLGSRGGFAFQLEDRSGHELPALQAAADALIRQANAAGTGVSRVNTSFTADKPTVLVDVDRDKAMSLGIGLDALTSSMQVYLGSVYVNDFDLLGRNYRVYVQADEPYRSRLADLDRIFVSDAGSPPIPLSSLVKMRQVKDPQAITHFDLYRSIEIDGTTAPGYGSGASIATMERLAQTLPPGYHYDWSGIAREERESGAQSAWIFALALAFVFVVLAAQYESLTSPLVILLAVPVALLGAVGGLWLRHLPADVFAQVGYVMLIGLAAKNAILIVEFANQLRRRGLDAQRAVAEAAATRFRPIVMTSAAFVIGVIPLLVASGAGSGARRSLGTVVFFGMIVSTVLNLYLIPVLYALAADLTRRRSPRSCNAPTPLPANHRAVPDIRQGASHASETP